jgi:trimeric autotransporter adhesin
MRPSRPALRPGALAAGLVLLLGTSAGAQSDILLQLESGSPAGDRFVVDSAGGFVARGTYNRGTIPATGAGTRLMWYPRKAAFRVGTVTGSQWSDATVGDYSVATGYNTTASGLSSTAIGNSSTASGIYSLAMGSGVTASGGTSTAMGSGTAASGPSSTAMGSSTAASGPVSTAMGEVTAASGWASTAMGSVTTASGDYSTAMGRGTLASGGFSTAMGYAASTQSYMGSFVYGDAATLDTVRASAAHQATWRTTGGFRIFTNTALTNGCSIVANGTAWSCTSSRLEKENFAEVDGEDVLRRLRSVPVTSWNGIAEGPQVRHIGPMAQDWHAAFALNDDPLTIHQGDLAGVSLAAVQALDGRTERQEERIRALEAENAALRERVEALSAGAGTLHAETVTLRSATVEQRTRLERLEVHLAALTAEP